MTFSFVKRSSVYLDVIVVAVLPSNLLLLEGSARPSWTTRSVVKVAHVYPYTGQFGLRRSNFDGLMYILEFRETTMSARFPRVILCHSLCPAHGFAVSTAMGLGDSSPLFHGASISCILVGVCISAGSLAPAISTG